VGVFVGLDIGAVSLKLAAIADAGQPAPSSGNFFVSHFPSHGPLANRTIILSSYRRILGSPVRATFELLDGLTRALPGQKLDGIRVTGSGGQLIASMLGATRENEFRSAAKAIRYLHPDVRTVFEMGGESAKYMRLDAAHDSVFLGIVDYQSSGDCAAGTGSFIDQQASRLRYTVEEVGAAACGASCAARVAGRCSVFAKTDMIHAQQKGYSTEQILRGLCEAVARS
jgi:activator of 2-hydroxyglutaryl-CoA dehydratase